ncbi:type VI secretion system Vgr family protein [Caballeronia mineralivorans]|uniref:type VI secretion system Vgr family protein n=1 Tax=Caballeronia mineralivorans TaxID=2010198 RepID=UPI00069D7477|nr:type VI secretion system tip protein TssI/VgrG [Caballeronia mineralivorans]
MIERNSLAPFFTFRSDVFADDTFIVLRWSCEEAVSQPYRLEVTLAARDASCDLNTLLDSRANFVVRMADGKQRSFRGIVRQATQFDSDSEYTYYRVELAPRFAALADYRYSEIYLNDTLPDIIRAVMSAGGLGTEASPGAGSYDFRIAISGADSEVTRANFVCQFEENCLDFLARRLEREGVYYYFEQLEDREAIVFCGGRSQQPDHGVSLAYRAPSTRTVADAVEPVERFACEVVPVPKAVVLRDFAGSHAALNLVVEEPVEGGRHGELTIYGMHFGTEKEGRRLAGVRAQALACQATRFSGSSRAPGLAAGYPATLADHPRSDFNAAYYVVQVRHEGWQPLPGRPSSGMRDGLEANTADDYRNEFVALPDATQFRTDTGIATPEIARLLTATIDSEGDGPYAQLNEHGCYKVRFPFARSARTAMRASAWLRLATPYAGAQHGMHFPLLKGTEVLIAFLNGDPDRPLIVGSVPNSENPSVVVDANAPQNAIRTAGGNSIVMDDTGSAQCVKLASPVANSHITLGAAAQPGLALVSDSHIQVNSSSYTQSVPGIYVETIKALAGAIPGVVSSSFNTTGLQASTASGMVTKNYLGLSTNIFNGMNTNMYHGAFNIVMAGLQTITMLAAKVEMGKSTTLDIKKGKVRKVWKDADSTVETITTTFMDRSATGASDTSHLAQATYNVGEYTLCAGMPVGEGRNMLKMGRPTASNQLATVELEAGVSAIRMSGFQPAAAFVEVATQHIKLNGQGSVAIGVGSTAEMSLTAAELEVDAAVSVKVQTVNLLLDAVTTTLNGEIIKIG